MSAFDEIYPSKFLTGSKESIKRNDEDLIELEKEYKNLNEAKLGK